MAPPVSAVNKATLHIRTLGDVTDPRSAVATFARRPGAFVLESVCNTRGYGRFTILGCQPIETVAIGADRRGGTSPDPLEVLSAAVHRVPTVEPAELPFPCGWVGYIPYEIGAGLEDIPRRSPAARAKMRFGLYDAAAIYDHVGGQWSLCAADLPGSVAPPETRLDRLVNILSSSPRAAEALTDRAASAGPVGPTPRSNMTKGQYLEKVARAIRYIEAGDIYQVNLTQRFSTRTGADALDLYLRLREANPADYAAYLPGDGRVVLSVSPELFLDVRGRRVVTRPIKGTAPRTGDERSDRASANELSASKKDRAELNMIIDLLRNDLGRVCEYGSVRVASEADVEIHPTVLHLVATIEGRLRDEVSAVDLLRAAFPGGSITGCPKIRAMQIIRELEPTERDVYCGSIGYIGLDGSLCLNIAIRTMLYEAGTVHVYAGGAITADSDPQAEYQETLAKAAGMFRALGYTTDEVQSL